MTRINTQLKILATKKVEAVVNYDFRNLSEINKFLSNINREVQTLWADWKKTEKVLAAQSKVTSGMMRLTPTNKSSTVEKKIKFVAPNKKKLEDAFKVIDHFHDKLEALDSTLNTLQVQFKGERGTAATIKAVNDLHKDVTKKMTAAYKTLEGLAKDHQPSEFKKTVDKYADELVKLFKGYFSKFDQTVYITPNPGSGGQDDSLLITRYLHFTDFTDDKDFAHKDYYIVFSCVINIQKSTKKVFVNTLSSFAPPTRFNVGVPLSESSVYRLLESDDFSTLHDRQPVRREMIKGDWSTKDIEKFEVDDNVFEFYFPKSITMQKLTKAKQDISKDLFANLRPMFPKMNLKTRQYTFGKHKIVEFAIVIPSQVDTRAVRTNARQIKVLQDVLGLTNKQVVQLIKGLTDLKD